MKNLYIIIPVYKGLNETKECISSVLKYASGYPLVIINDSSPDTELNIYLESLKNREPLIHVFNNPVNMGFVKTVNMGLQFDEEKDVIILNSDTVVTSNWVEKLQYWAYSDPKAATVTPMSNSATICSYPVICKQNLLPDNLSPDQLNSYFEKAVLYHEDELIEIPTGVGFCLFIKREYLEKIGYFNETLFGTGYGEENDFCLRCVNKGARHLVAVDTFIFHNEGISFGADQKQKQTANAIKVLNRLYPDYDATIQHYIETDPLTITRRRVDLVRFFMDQKKSILFISHGKGGGVDKHVYELSEMFVAKGWRPFILTPFNNRGVVIESASPGEEFSLTIDSRNWLTKLARLLKDIKVCHLHFHHIIDYHIDIYKLPEITGLQYDFTLHDFYMFCPNISGYIDEEDYFCGFDPKRNCDCCATKEGKYFFNYFENDIKLFRKTNQRFLKAARKIISPSHSTKTFYHRYYPSLEIEVHNHPEAYNFKDNQENKVANINFHSKDNDDIQNKSDDEKILNIGLLGGLSPKKGRKIFEECLSLSRRKKLPVRWILIGYTEHSDNTEEDDFIITGRYKKNELPDLIFQYQIQLILIPARWPETYSYTLSESFALGCPVMVPDIGALTERVEKRGGGIILESPITADAIIKEIEKIINDSRKLNEISINNANVTEMNFDNYFSRIYNTLTFESTYNRDSSVHAACRQQGQVAIQVDNMRFYERLINQSVLKTFINDLRKIKNEHRLTQNHVNNLDGLYKSTLYEFERLKGENRLTQDHVVNIEGENKRMQDEKNALKEHIVHMGMTKPALRIAASNIKQMPKNYIQSTIRKIKKGYTK
jgi:GT2 family glycosyltransferase/glycosyltransferase involved in cell wall biosynthesis